MRIVINIFLLSLIFSVPILGQHKLPKIVSVDNSITPKAIIQKRIITKYFYGGTFSCKKIGTIEVKCDYQKFLEIIWQCWNEKTLCYLKLIHSGVDGGAVEHIFIEPNKKNQWLVVRRKEYWSALYKSKRPIENLPIVYSVDWSERDGEKILLLKDNFGKVIAEY